MVYLSYTGGLIAPQTTTDRHIRLEQNKVLCTPKKIVAQLFGGVANLELLVNDLEQLSIITQRAPVGALKKFHNKNT